MNGNNSTRDKFMAAIRENNAFLDEYGKKYGPNPTEYNQAPTVRPYKGAKTGIPNHNYKATNKGVKKAISYIVGISIALGFIGVGTRAVLYSHNTADSTAYLDEISRLYNRFPGYFDPATVARVEQYRNDNTEFLDHFFNDSNQYNSDVTDLRTEAYGPFRQIKSQTFEQINTTISQMKEYLKETQFSDKDSAIATCLIDGDSIITVTFTDGTKHRMSTENFKNALGVSWYTFQHLCEFDDNLKNLEYTYEHMQEIDSKIPKFQEELSPFTERYRAYLSEKNAQNGQTPQSQVHDDDGER